MTAGVTSPHIDPEPLLIKFQALLMRGTKNITKGDWEMVEINLQDVIVLRGDPADEAASASPTRRLLEAVFFQLCAQHNEFIPRRRDQLTWEDLPQLRLALTPLVWVFAHPDERPEMSPLSFTWRVPSFDPQDSAEARIWRREF